MSNVAGTIPNNLHIQKWVNEMAAMCRPDNVYWCDGSEDEREKLTQVAVQCGDLITLNQKALPGCYLHRSALNDVARTENLTRRGTEIGFRSSFIGVRRYCPLHSHQWGRA